MATARDTLSPTDSQMRELSYKYTNLSLRKELDQDFWKIV